MKNHQLKRYDVISVKHHFAKFYPYRHWAIIYSFDANSQPILFDISKTNGHIRLSSWDKVVGNHSWRKESLKTALSTQQIQQNMDDFLSKTNCKYNVITNNCEQVIRQVIQEKHQSKQVKKAFTHTATITAVATSAFTLARLFIIKK